MERLTNKREADAQRKEYERRLANGYPRNIPEERFLRLAAYEDTHMMPSDVTSMRMDMAIIAALFNGIDVDRMKELAEADRAGRLVVLPCKEGDAIYHISKVRTSHFEDDKIIIDDDGRWKIYEMPFALIHLPYIGKSYFLTREEAEKALEAMKDGN